MCEPAKVIGCLLQCLADDRYIQTSTDHLSDLEEPHTLIGNCMVARCHRTRLQHEPVESTSIQPMHRGPVVEPFTNVRRYTLFTREADEERDESVIADSVDRRRKPEH
jgi:hypothetical protein